jgi:hypothetical protein
MLNGSWRFGKSRGVNERQNAQSRGTWIAIDRRTLFKSNEATKLNKDLNSLWVFTEALVFKVPAALLFSNTLPPHV